MLALPIELSKQDSSSGWAIKLASVSGRWYSKKTIYRCLSVSLDRNVSNVGHLIFQIHREAITAISVVRGPICLHVWIRGESPREGVPHSDCQRARDLSLCEGQVPADVSEHKSEVNAISSCNRDIARRCLPVEGQVPFFSIVSCDVSSVDSQRDLWILREVPRSCYVSWELLFPSVRVATDRQWTDQRDDGRLGCRQGLVCAITIVVGKQLEFRLAAVRH